jgi:hypothetical protein
LAGSDADVQVYSSDSAPLSSEPDDPEHLLKCQKKYHALILLARTLEERHRYTGDARDLESASKYGAEALAACRAENIVCPTLWTFYADILAGMFEVTTNSEELSMAELLCRDAIPLCTAAHPLSATIFHTLSWIYLRMFDQSGDEALIDEAVHLQRVALERLPEAESHNKHRHLRRLALVLTRKQYDLGHQDKDGVLSILSEAFRLCPPTHVDRWTLHTGMMRQLVINYVLFGEFEFLDKATELGRQALGIGVFPDPARRATFLFLMADILRTRYERAGTADRDLEESIELSRKAVQISLPGDANHCIHVHGLALVLELQFRSDGDLSHLEEASQLYHYAIGKISKASPWRPMIITSLAQSFGLRFRETGDISELDRAIDLDKEAVATFHPSTLNNAISTMQMVSHLCLRFEVLHCSDDLKTAIGTAEELLRSLPNSDIDRPELIHILAKARLLHAIDSGSLGNIDLAIEQLLFIKNNVSGSLIGPETLRTLAACHLVKFRQSLIIDHAIHARNAINEVLEAVTEDHYERFDCLIDAAELYMEHGTPYYSLDVAIKHLSDALKNSHRDVRSKIRGANRVLIKLEIGKQDIFATKSSTSLKLLDVIASAVLLLPRIAFFGIHPHSRLQSLQAGQNIAMTGASLSLNLSFPEKALEIMEQGRAIFWTHTLRLRSPFDEIPGELRDRLISLARRLEKVANVSENSTDQQSVEREIAQRRKESHEFNLLVEQVRSLPGLEHFMLPDDYLTLKEVAKQSPVVVLVSSTLACHAIVLKSSGEAASIPLEAITDKWLSYSASVWRSAVMQARSAMRNERKLVKSKKSPGSTQTQAEQILRLLWENVVLPVIRALQIEVSLSIIRLESDYSRK